MKIIFLDIDGVLNCESSKSRSPCGFIGIDDSRVKLLREIVEATEAKIVLISTWQKEWKPEGLTETGRYLIRKLWRKRLYLFSRTGRYSWNDRGLGIAEWLKKCPEEVESWIVLDDEIFDDYPRYGIMPHLVQTDFYQEGLTEKHVKRAIELLGRNDDYISSSEAKA